MCIEAKECHAQQCEEVSFLGSALGKDQKPRRISSGEDIVGKATQEEIFGL